jgi:hypothetical protein
VRVSRTAAQMASVVEVWRANAAGGPSASEAVAASAAGVFWRTRPFGGELGGAGRRSSGSALEASKFTRPVFGGPSEVGR